MTHLPITLDDVIYATEMVGVYLKDIREYFATQPLERPLYEKDHFDDLFTEVSCLEASLKRNRDEF